MTQKHQTKPMLIKDEPNPISFVNRTPNITTRGRNQHHVPQTSFAQTFILQRVTWQDIRNNVSPTVARFTSPSKTKKRYAGKKCSLTPKAAVLHMTKTFDEMSVKVKCFRGPWSKDFLIPSCSEYRWETSTFFACDISNSLTPTQTHPPTMYLTS